MVCRRIVFCVSAVLLAASCGCGGGGSDTVPGADERVGQPEETLLSEEQLPLPKGAEVTRYEGMSLVWHDEFDEDGPLSDAWSYEEGFVRNEELQWYQKDNASVAGGVLVIEARRETKPNPHYVPGSTSWRTNRPAAEYTSSCVTTAGSFSFRYGRLEVRAKIPVDQGAWPAIWTLGNRWEWPQNGEVDLLEFYIRNGVPGILANACWGGKQPYTAVWDDTHTPYTHFTDQDAGWADKYHLWRMDWDKEWIRLYLDGELLNEIDLSQTVNGGVDGNTENPFVNDVEGFGDYILLNLAIGSNGGDPSQTLFPMQYCIDYVRVYQ